MQENEKSSTNSPKGGKVIWLSAGRNLFLRFLQVTGEGNQCHLTAHLENCTLAEANMLL